MRTLCRCFSQSLCHVYRMLIIGSSLVLSACTGANIIDADVSDFRNSFARASDEQILRNILRARDQVPLHFSELQSISATIQQTASLSTTAPFGPRRGSTVRDTLTAAVGLQNNPQFSVGTLETQEFTKGILSPIEPKIIKQFVDRGIDPRIILILFFSEVQPAVDLKSNKEPKPLTNSFPCMDFSLQRCSGSVLAYLKAVSKIANTGIRVNVYTELAPVGPPVHAKEGGAGATANKTQFAAKDVAGIDYSKFRLKSLKDVPDTFQLYSVSAPKIAFCPEDEKKAATTIVPFFALKTTDKVREECTKDEIVVPETPSPSLQRPKFEIRSVYQMIQYLGQILAYQDYFADSNSCILLPGNYGSCETGGVLFQVNSSRGTPVISTPYGGRHYFVVDGSCQRASPCDHSTQVLDILAVLLNTNKVAKDIPNPAVVQVVQ